MMAVMARMFHQISQHLRCEARALFARHGANFTCHEERDTWGSIASHQGSLSLSLHVLHLCQLPLHSRICKNGPV